jgi:hypothetical protein
MVLASVHLRGLLDIRHFEYYQGGECLSNAHLLGPWRQHLMTNYGLRQNHRKNQEVGLGCTLFCDSILDYIYKICELHRAIFSSLYNISQPNFALLLILRCSF